MDTKELVLDRARELVKEFSVFNDMFDSTEKWDSIEEIVANIKFMNDKFASVVYIVEQACYDVANTAEGIKSVEKREIAAQLLDDLIKFPWYLELFDKQFFSVVLSIVVDFLNSKYGSNWNLDKFRVNVSQGVSLIR